MASSPLCVTGYSIGMFNPMELKENNHSVHRAESQENNTEMKFILLLTVQCDLAILHHECDLVYFGLEAMVCTGHRMSTQGELSLANFVEPHSNSHIICLLRTCCRDRWDLLLWDSVQGKYLLNLFFMHTNTELSISVYV